MTLLPIDSQGTLDRTLMWYSPVPHFKPRIKTPRTTLKIACIVSNRLYQGLRYEGELLLLTPENWKRLLDHGHPDFLLIESCWDTVTGHWYLSQTHPGEEQNILNELVRHCRTKEIPTVFWNTQDKLYYDFFNDFAKNFDVVFCSDFRVADQLKTDSIDCDILLPAIQPAIHNPFRDFQFGTKFGIDILYDGWADLFRMPDSIEFLKEFKDNGLSIIESRYRLLQNKRNDTEEYIDNILGCVNAGNRIMALKYARLSIMADATLSTPTHQAWMSLENSACRVPVLYRGELSQNNVKSGVVIPVSSDEEIVEEAKHILSDNLLREKQAHIGWRKVYQQHTYSHRVQTICEKIGIKHDWEEHPLISIIMPTYREELISRCIETYDKQKFPNKELVIVFNKNALTFPQISELDVTRKDITVLTVPQENYTGACMNRGLMSAKGEYFFKMDDDDYYGEHYITDMMLHLKSVEADVFGKLSSYWHFEHEKKLYSFKNAKRQLPFSIPARSIVDGMIYLAGYTLSGKRNKFNAVSFDNAFFGAADLAFQMLAGRNVSSIFTFDSMNCVYSRRNDGSHTWSQLPQQVYNNLNYCGSSPQEIII